MSKKMRVGILFGGKSAEHEISLLSAKSVIEAMDPNKYEIVLLGINKKGEWFLHEDLNHCLLNQHDPKQIYLKNTSNAITIVPNEKGNSLISLMGEEINRTLDVVFPILHGTYGEDGTIQGLLKLANIPFVGAGVLGSAIGMDKDVMKRLLRDANIPIARFLSFHKHEFNTITFEKVKEALGTPFFIKPANLGSSVGISKIKNKNEFYEKLALAFEYDRKILIEEHIPGREIECSVLGNEEPMVSLPGELIPQHEFYSYEAKYLDDKGAIFEIPVVLPQPQIQLIQSIAIKAYKTLCCEGMARVDMFLKENGEVLINEINTIPGFTKISMYPKLWEKSGLKYPELIDRLIELAIDRFNKEQSLKTNFECMPQTSEVIN